jgi:hypothetical protein
MTYWYIYISLPGSKAKARGKNIDRYLPYAINFINTMSVAGISPAEIFETLSTIDLYYEVQKEAKKITTEIELMGLDAITALKNAITISPSKNSKNSLTPTELRSRFRLASFRALAAGRSFDLPLSGFLFDPSPGCII